MEKGRRNLNVHEMGGTKRRSYSQKNKISKSTHTFVNIKHFEL